MLLLKLRRSAAIQAVSWMAVSTFLVTVPLHADPLDGRWDFDEERSWNYFLDLHPQYRDVDEVRSAWIRSQDPDQYFVIADGVIRVFTGGERLVHSYEVAHAAGNAITMRWRRNPRQEYEYDTIFVVEDDAIFLYWPPCEPSHEHCRNSRLYYRRPAP